jgi:hypothetical protein
MMCESALGGVEPAGRLMTVAGLFATRRSSTRRLERPLQGKEEQGKRRGEPAAVHRHWVGRCGYPQSWWN